MLHNWRSELQFEENYNEFLRLLQDEDYLEVTFDKESGGVSAVHKLHKFDKQIGPYGVRRGDYELTVVKVLRRLGHRIVLEAEPSSGEKKCDGLLDDVPTEIKAIEGTGEWAISTKLLNAERQRAQCVALYFPRVDLFSLNRVVDGIGKYSANPEFKGSLNINQILAVTEDGLLGVWDKKATPIEGWSIWEGFRRQNGANPFTISPSNAKVKRIL